jgi:hypothetical protein
MPSLHCVIPRRSARSVRFLSLLAVGLSAVPASAQTWSGLGGNASWSTNGNWVGNTAPSIDMLPPFFW